MFSWIHYPGLLSPGKRAMRGSVFWTLALCVILSGVVYSLTLAARDVQAQSTFTEEGENTPETDSAGDDNSGGSDSNDSGSGENTGDFTEEDVDGGDRPADARGGDDPINGNQDADGGDRPADVAGGDPAGPGGTDVDGGDRPADAARGDQPAAGELVRDPNSGDGSEAGSDSDEDKALSPECQAIAERLVNGSDTAQAATDWENQCTDGTVTIDINDEGTRDEIAKGTKVIVGLTVGIGVPGLGFTAWAAVTAYLSYKLQQAGVNPEAAEAGADAYVEARQAGAAPEDAAGAAEDALRDLLYGGSSNESSDDENPAEDGAGEDGASGSSGEGANAFESQAKDFAIESGEFASDAEEAEAAGDAAAATVAAEAAGEAAQGAWTASSQAWDQAKDTPEGSEERASADKAKKHAQDAQKSADKAQGHADNATFDDCVEQKSGYGRNYDGITMGDGVLRAQSECNAQLDGDNSGGEGSGETATGEVPTYQECIDNRTRGFYPNPQCVDIVEWNDGWNAAWEDGYQDAYSGAGKSPDDVSSQSAAYQGGYENGYDPGYTQGQQDESRDNGGPCTVTQGEIQQQGRDAAIQQAVDACDLFPHVENPDGTLTPYSPL